MGPDRNTTTVLREEKYPTLSLLVPFKSMIQLSMTPAEDDSKECVFSTAGGIGTAHKNKVRP